MSKLGAKIGGLIHAYKTEVSTDEKMSVKETFACGMVEFGNNAQAVLILTYCKYFVMVILGIDPMTVGVIFATITIIEGVRNPLMSVMIDCTKTRFGRFRPYVMIAAPVAALVSIMFFLNPFDATQTENSTIWIYVSYLAWTTIYCLSTAAWGGLQKCITRNENEKDRFFALGRGLNVVSGMIPSLTPIIVDFAAKFGWHMRYIFIGMAVTFGLIGMLSLLLARNIRERITIPRIENPFKNIKTVFKNKYNILFWFQNVSGLLVNVGYGGAAYMFIHCYGGYSFQTITWTVGGIGAWIFLFLSGKVLKRFSHKAIHLIDSFVFALGSFAIYFLGFDSAIPLLACSAFMHIFEYVASVSTSVVNTNIMDYNEWKFGIRNEATTGMVGGLIGSAFGALNSLLIGYALTYIGFRSGENVVQTEATKQGLFFLYTVFVGAGTLLGSIPWMLYDLNDKKVAEIKVELEARRKKVTPKIDFVGFCDDDGADIDFRGLY